MRRAWTLGVTMILLLGAGPEPALHEVDATGVLGRDVHDADGRDIGRIVDVVVEPSGKPIAVVVDAGGFMGVGTRRVAVDWAAVHMPAPGVADLPVTIDLTDTQVRSAPEYTDRTRPAIVVGAPDTTPADAETAPTAEKAPNPPEPDPQASGGKAPAP